MMKAEVILIMRLGEWLRAARKQKGLKLVDLAKETGLSHSYLSQIETGLKTGPSDEVLEALARSLGLDANQLRSLAEEEACREELQDLKGLIASSADRLRKLSDVVDSIGAYYDEGDDGGESRPGTSDSNDDSEWVIDLSGLQAPMRANGDEQGSEGMVDRDYVKQVRRVPELLSELQGLLASSLEKLSELEARLSHPRFQKEVEEIAVQTQSLGDRGIWFIREQLKIASRLLRESNTCTKEKTGGMTSERPHQKASKTLLVNCHIHGPKDRSQDRQSQEGLQVVHGKGNEEGGRGQTS